MKKILLIIMTLALVSCGSEDNGVAAGGGSGGGKKSINGESADSYYDSFMSVEGNMKVLTDNLSIAFTGHQLILKKDMGEYEIGDPQGFLVYEGKYQVSGLNLNLTGFGVGSGIQSNGKKCIEVIPDGKTPMERALFCL